METKKTIFLQPRHVYAPEAGTGHVYLSAPLITFMARLNAAGLPVDSMQFLDENFENTALDLEEADSVAINLVGAPYIPEVIGLVSKRLRSGARAILGGQIIDALSQDEFNKLFVGLRDDVEIVKAGNAEVQKFFNVPLLPRAEEVSSIPVWECVSDEKMKEYLSREISFYLSQGCMFRCSFCQAAKGQRESYRDLNLAIQDLRWLAEKAIQFGLRELPIYLSNLDLFQNAKSLESFLKDAHALGSELDFEYKFRGLATVHSIVTTDLDDLKRYATYGLKEVGIGIDGATPHIWKKTKKVQNLSRGEKNDAKKCIEAIEKIHDSGMVPEMLMVLGHDGGDLQTTVEDMLTAREFVQEMQTKFDVKVHPYLVKFLIPGADAWKDPQNSDLVQYLITHPEHFKDLDFAATPSQFSHPDPEVREAVRSNYLMFIKSIEAEDDLIYSRDDPDFYSNQGKFDR